VNGNHGIGADTWQLVPLPVWEVTEPTRAAVVRAERNPLLAGPLTLALAGSVLPATRRRRARPTPRTGPHPARHPKAAGEQR
jgi:hypothetical protein